MSFAFHIVDVFTSEAFAGNQLAVLTDARGLSTDRMQAIAREFNFAETSFVLPPEDPANTAHVRIFTPAEEMPFAGHPNVGTGFVLARIGQLFGKPLADAIVFEEQAGLVHVGIERRDGIVTGATVKAPRTLSIGARVEAAIVAELAGLIETDIVTSRFAPCFASVGAEFLLAEVGREALDRARPDAAAFGRHEGRIGQSAGLMGLHLHCRDMATPGALEVRMFAPLSGVPEDAATGAAAAALGAFLHNVDPSGRRFTMRQGRHIGRPSLIAVSAGPDGVTIGGDCALFAEGCLSA